MSYKILFIDDEINSLKTISVILKKHNYTVFTAQTVEEGISQLQKHKPHCLLLDYRLPGKDGIEMLKWLKKENINIPVIMLTAYGTIEKAVEAMKLGAFHYLVKPVDPTVLLETIKEAISKHEILSHQEDISYKFPEIIAKSQAMREIFYIIEMVADSNSNVLITGESGTGKELVARAIHRLSKRKNHPFIVVDCATIPDNLLESELFGYEKGAFTGATERKIGLIELANSGTIFLDEIGDLSLNLQKKLLRFLQEREIQRLGSLNKIKVDVRVIAATNRDLERAVKEGVFREDLYWRLNVVRIHLPPLRERKEDIPLLVQHFVQKFAKENNRPIPTIEPEVLDVLLNYDWPGNVRELANVIERAVILSTSGVISLKHLPKRILGKESKTNDFSLNTLNLLEMEKALIIKALNETGWNQTKAAQLLGISRKQLRTKMKHHGLLPISSNQNN
ncbi:two component, sigma54 specific, transcriptional regulator, Fis family [Thermodesulfobacterium geofontis OPF15]|jgi:two-component system response regulator HydG/two-component system response regulator AtoC|uniref:Two component, sigma54 specific, transcriptional regulator, Fis family n=1 Tax=Thermodesulfobacterium geofontis (strain OPF15) TaxID=795359 RepID=F8C5L4_THEGP|nr:sigma-54 dependent transcriptional regulator [Thermodesulfobacterium geofontis]AEH22993.1 two component, sigma54 specific, transcriptional regulator, Fis family [Thermodesulfobacterium geofontis OPF15]